MPEIDIIVNSQQAVNAVQDLVVGQFEKCAYSGYGIISSERGLFKRRND
jgi:hypothetical protein